MAEKLKVINIIAGPGAGKSTTAAGIFYNLKSLDINCELVTEFAKEKVWDKHLTILDDQLYLTAKQFHRLFRLIGQVDVAITDSPFPLGWYYNNKEMSKGRMGECLTELIRCCYDWFDNYNYFILREKKFNPKGRVQNEKESRAIDTILAEILKEKKIPYICVPGNDTSIDLIVNSFLKGDKGC